MNAPNVQYVTTSDGYNIAYTVIGAGSPWILVPAGFHHLRFTAPGGNEGAWASNLSDRYTVVQYDCRGQGLSTRGLAEAHRQEDLDLDLVALTTHLDLPPVVLFAKTNATHIAVRFAARHPALVRALVLLAFSDVVDPIYSLGLYRDLAQSDWDMFLEVQLRTELNEYIDAGGKGNEPPTKEHISQILTQRDFIRMFAGFRESNIGEEIHRVVAPVLILFPQGGRQSIEEVSRLAGLFPRGRLAEVGGFGLRIDYNSSIGPIEAMLAETPAPGEVPTSGSQAAGEARPSVSIHLRGVRSRYCASSQRAKQTARSLKS